MINLSGEQEGIKNKLLNFCEKVEKDLSIPISPNEPQQIQDHIEKLRIYLSEVPKMLSTATALYDYAKGQCAEMIIADGKILNAKANIQKMWIDGKLEAYNEIFILVENTTKSLDKSISGLISLLSIEKEKIKYNIHQD